VTLSFQHGKHCAISFTHEPAKDMSMDVAKQYAENILSIIQKGLEPSITTLHAQRVTSEGFPPLIPASYKEQIKAFDPIAVNKNIQGLFTQHPGAIRVESITTSMGCVMTTCVVEVEHLARLTNGVISWAKPIIEVAQAKSAVCLEWRKKLELGADAAHPGIMDPSSARKMQVGAMFQEDDGNVEV
jgi:hypothetical protein